jgi:ribosomal protein L19E
MKDIRDMRNVLIEVKAHLMGDKNTWEELMNDAKETSFKTGFSNKVYDLAKMEAESDGKLLKKLEKVI